ncbi:MAG: hypothetical protein JW955_19095 [Sedimentisphaerales bacterium]|nr:hypothetical protein [Sedimentisphaerales bacterium]
MRRIAFLVAILSLVPPVAAQDWEGDLLGLKGDLHGSIGVTWDSKYLWRGFDVYDDKSAVHVVTDLSLFDTGFGFAVAGHRANPSGCEDKERWDFTAYYQNGLFKETPFLTQFRFGWTYYDYPELNAGESLNLQEAHLIVSWPDILPVKGLCPTYAAVCLWPSATKLPLADASGWLHIFMLDYGFSLPSLIPGPSKEQLVKLHSEVVYNEGFSPTPARPVNDWHTVYTNPDHDWSHAVFGVSTDFNFGHGLFFTPALYYQRTMDRSINDDDDELWASLNVRFTF